MSRSRELAELATAYDSGSPLSFRNRIINGQMMIDQRNAGASVTPSIQAYTVDRFLSTQVGGGAFSIQRSTTAPAGFVNSAAMTVTTADASIASGDVYTFEHRIEGFNVADLAWGTASAQTVTLSFWVRSSITGTYAGGLKNSANNRSYVFTYAINSANTWEYKTITVSGDTSGTWLTDSGIGIQLILDLGSGSSSNGTAGAWQAASAIRTSGSANWIGTNGATWYITGVQLEKGSTATSFDFRSYGTELALCHRYYYRRNFYSGQYVANLQAFASGSVFGKVIDLPVTMRAGPTANTSSVGHFTAMSAGGTQTTAFTSGTFAAATSADQIGTGGLGGSSGLVAGNSSVVITNNASWIDVSAEL